MYGKTNSVVIKADLPTDTLSIVQNGEYDVLNYAKASVNVPQSEIPGKGVIFSDYDSDGYPHTATIKEMFEIISSNNKANVIKGMFGTDLSAVQDGNPYLSKLEKIILNSTNSISTFKEYCFANLTSLKEIVCINGYSDPINYESYSFFNTGFESLTLTNVGTINGEAFGSCKKLKTVNFINCSPKVLGLASNIFYECTALTNVELPNNLTEISSWTFYGCTSLINLIIPESVTRVEARALIIGSSTNKATITFKSTTPPTITSNTFKAETINKIYVPSASVESYKTAANWVNFADYIEANPKE